MQDEVRELLVRTVRALGDVADEMVFVGGATTGLLITDRAAPEVRVTKDVDVIIQVSNASEFYEFEERLRERGFTEDRQLVCRWHHSHSVILDMMPTDEKILGFSNRWYEGAIASATLYELDSSISIRLITAPYFCATKLVAFDGRGNRDYASSHDLEDFLSVVDGRTELVDEINEAEPPVRAYLAERVRALVDSSDFVDTLGGFLPPDRASQARLTMLLDRLNQIAAS